MRGGLRVLRMMVDHWGPDSFSLPERERLSDLAALYIRARRYVT